MQEHIAGSINIPEGDEATFEDRFARDKAVIVYSASPECDASSRTARELAERGFSHVFEYRGGLDDWKSAGRETASG